MKRLFVILAFAALVFGALSVSADDGFILLEGGTVTLGSPETERMREGDETPHEVTLSPFYIDPYEVTQRDYARVMGTNPSIFQGEDLPVDNVTWYDTVNYCNALSEEAGLTPVYTVDGDTVTWDRAADGYRLLTEAEWEYACRAGTDTIYSFGDQVNSDYANFQGSYPYLIEENYVSRKDPTVKTSQNRGTTIAPGSLPANAFGIYDMHGNVSEWVFDYYGAYSDGTDPYGADSGHLRVNRGGGYNDFGKHLRSAYRSAMNPSDPDQNTGFRVARSAQPGKGTITTTYEHMSQTPEDPKVLIAYFSYSGNTRKAAQIIQSLTGADLFEIQMETPYGGGIYDVTQKDLMDEYRPPLASTVENFADYDVILLGYPTWWATLPMPVVSFLESYDFTGKTVYSFSSHGGTMFGDSVSDLSKLIQTAYVGEGFEFHYGGGSSLESELSDWLKECGVL